MEKRDETGKAITEDAAKGRVEVGTPADASGVAMPMRRASGDDGGERQ